MVTEVEQEAVQGNVARLERRMRFRNEPEVSIYLKQHPDLVTVLLEALDELPAHFGPDTPMVLEVLTDPEEEDEIRTLSAIIQTTFEPERAIALEDRFIDAWWREASFRTGDRLTFGIEYV